VIRRGVRFHTVGLDFRRSRGTVTRQRLPQRSGCRRILCGSGGEQGREAYGMVEDRFLKRLRKKARKGLRGWPIATVAFYGPNLSQATKVALGIVPSENAEARQSYTGLSWR
jgi:hypothetical protein